ncbi:histidine kinase [Halosquirtibacter laminarini]|uniref:Histidine kinase n=1 Tax=Halosquirtibacter laminarini TaxID=3374600 RepID=A0AC61NDC4_9BACT|nr:histidine kinase [Prolixibacteraceae bacterium]
MKIPSKVRIYLGIAFLILSVGVLYLFFLRNSLYEKAKEEGRRFNIIGASENLELIKSYFVDYESVITYFANYPHRQQEFPSLLKTYVDTEPTVVDGWYTELTDDSELSGWAIDRKKDGHEFYTIGPYLKNDSYYMDLGILSSDKDGPFILGITIDLYHFHDKVTKLDIHSSNYIEIVDPYGRYIYHPDIPFIGKKAETINDKNLLNKSGIEISEALRVGFSEYLQINVIRACREMSIGGHRWLLIGNTPELNYTEFIATIERILLWVLLIFVVCILSIVLISWYFSDREHRLRLRAEESLYQVKISEERRRKEMAVMELQLLKIGLDPHFIFNSLSSLIVLIPRNSDDACLFAKRLSNLFRFQLSTQMKELVSLESELSFTQDYFAIQKLRFGDRIAFEINFSDSSHLEDLKIPPGSLQLLVENALKHNIATKKEPLRIKIFERDEYIIVQNNLNLRTSETFSSNLGQRLMILRIKDFTDSPCRFYISDNFYLSEIPIVFNRS